jgi:hypothetical protein
VRLKRVCLEPVVHAEKPIGKPDLGAAADLPAPWTPEPAA